MTPTNKQCCCCWWLSSFPNVQCSLNNNNSNRRKTALRATTSSTNVSMCVTAEAPLQSSASSDHNGSRLCGFYLLPTTRLDARFYFRYIIYLISLLLFLCSHSWHELWVVIVDIFISVFIVSWYMLKYACSYFNVRWVGGWSIGQMACVESSLDTDSSSDSFDT